MCSWCLVHDPLLDITGGSGWPLGLRPFLSFFHLEQRWRHCLSKGLSNLLPLAFLVYCIFSRAVFLERALSLGGSTSLVFS